MADPATEHNLQQLREKLDGYCFLLEQLQATMTANMQFGQDLKRQFDLVAQQVGADAGPPVPAQPQPLAPPPPPMFVAAEAAKTTRGAEGLPQPPDPVPAGVGLPPSHPPEDADKPDKPSEARSQRRTSEDSEKPEKPTPPPDTRHPGRAPAEATEKAEKAEKASEADHQREARTSQVRARTGDKDKD